MGEIGNEIGSGDFGMTTLTNDELDNSSNLFSSATEEPQGGTEAEMVMYMLGFLGIIGTAGNAIVLYVFMQRKDRLVSTVYIISLAVVDFITCLVVIPFTIYMERIGFATESDITCKVYQFLITSNIPFSALIMVAIAVDRYLCICHPWRSAALMNVRRAKIVVLILASFAIAIGIIVGLMYGVYHEVEVPVDSTSIAPEVEFSESHSNSTSPHSRPLIAEDMTTTRSAVYAFHTGSGSPYINMDTKSLNRLQNSDYAGVTYDSRQPISDELTAAVTAAVWKVLRNTGQCDTNEVIIGIDFQWYYQRVYVAMYVVCLVAVIALYVAIFCSVSTRRRRKQEQQKRRRLVVVSSTAAASNRRTSTSRYPVCADSATTVITTDSGGSGSTLQRPSSMMSSSYASGCGSNLSQVAEMTNTCEWVDGETGEADSVTLTVQTAPTETTSGRVDPTKNGSSGFATAKTSLVTSKNMAMTVLKTPPAAATGNGGGNRQKRRNNQGESTFLANLRTASMLFVVTVVFIVTFTPGFLMSLEWLPFNMTVFYLYFANNVANPVIYSFMNRNFRADLQRLVCQRK